MGISAGMLNRRIRIERREGKDAAGQPLDNWVPVVDVWANIRGQTGMGTITQPQDNVPASIERYSVRIRYREDIDMGMRIVCGPMIMDIRQIRLDLERREWTDLVCEVGGTNG